MSGGEGNDTLEGRLGRDTLHGGSGEDILKGGGGFAGSEADILIGGKDADVFYYQYVNIPPAGTRAPLVLPQLTLDEIADYNQGDTGSYNAKEGDVIDVSEIVGAFYGAGNGDSEDQLVRTVYDSGLHGAIVEIDVDGSANGEDWVPFAFLAGVRSGHEVRFRLDPNSTGPASPSLSAISSVRTAYDVTMTVQGEPGSWTITPSSRTVIESNTTISFTVTRPNDSTAETIYVSTTVNQGYANNGDYDYWLNEAVTFAAGETTKTINIDINEDSIDEPIETFGLIVQSSPDQPASQYLAQSTFSIIDDDISGGTPTFTENDDLVWIEPTGGAETFNGLGGIDTVVLDLSDWDGGISTSTPSGSRQFTQGTESIRFYNVETFYVLGGSGNDTLYGGNQGNGLFGGAGNDTLVGGDGIDVLDGGAGDDTFSSVGAGDTVTGGTGTDTVNFDLSAVTTDLTFDLPNGLGANGSWTGVEIASGTFGQGDDTVDVGFQRAYLNGHTGTDHLTLDYSGTLADGRSATYVHLNLHNQSTDEAVFLSDSSAVGFDIVGFETFAVTGTSGNDNIYGGNAGNTLNGGAGNDTLRGGDGIDVLNGGSRADHLDGGSGNDRLIGGGGNDTILGGAGRDRIIGGAGDDTLSGGADVDRFIFKRGNDTVTDFNGDRLILDDALWGGAPLSTSQVMDFAEVVGSTTVFDFGSGNTLTLDNFTAIGTLEQAITII